MLTRIKRFFLALFGKLNDEPTPITEEELTAEQTEPEPKPAEEEPITEEPEIEETIFIPETEDKPIVCKTCGSMVFADEDFCTSCGEVLSE